MELRIIPHSFSVCKIKSIRDADMTSEFVFLCKTDEEISLVCPTETAPSDTLGREDGWRAFAVCGILDFSLVGILAEISSHLAAADIGIFAVSTFNTDYILTKSQDFDKALEVLKKAGHTVF